MRGNRKPHAAIALRTGLWHWSKWTQFCLFFNVHHKNQYCTNYIKFQTYLCKGRVYRGVKTKGTNQLRDSSPPFAASVAALRLMCSSGLRSTPKLLSDSCAASIVEIESLNDIAAGFGEQPKIWCTKELGAAKRLVSLRVCFCSSSKAKASARIRAASWAKCESINKLGRKHVGI